MVPDSSVQMPSGRLVPEDKGCRGLFPDGAGDRFVNFAVALMWDTECG